MTERKKKANQNSKIIFALAAIALIYLGARYVMTVFNPIETTSAVRMTVDDSVSATGYFIRDEQIVPAADSDTVEYTVLDGEKVYRGAELAMEYADADALETNRKIDTLQSNIALLLSASQTAGDLSDVSKLDQLITIQMNEINEMVDTGSISGLAEVSNNLRALTLKRSSTSEDVSALTKEAQELKAEVNSLQNGITGKTRRINSPYSGYFSDTVDGYENLLRASQIDQYTLSTFQKLSEASVKPENDHAMGKIINGFSWYFAAAVPSSEADKMKKGQAVSLRFAQVSSEVPVKIYSIRSEGNSDKTLIIFQSMVLNEDMVSMRKQSVDIIRHTYTGLKIPKEAIRMVDGQMGVYVLNGDVSKFKRIKPLYEGDNYYLIEQNSADENGVVVMDDIIVKAKDLEDKKVVK